MSSFNCEYCRKAILDTPDGYITGCEHYPIKDYGKKGSPREEKAKEKKEPSPAIAKR